MAAIHPSSSAWSSKYKACYMAPSIFQEGSERSKKSIFVIYNVGMELYIVVYPNIAPTPAMERSTPFHPETRLYYFRDNCIVSAFRVVIAT